MRRIAKYGRGLALCCLWVASALVAVRLLSAGYGGMHVVNPVAENHRGVTYSGGPSDHAAKVLSTAPETVYERMDLQLDFCIDELTDFANVFQTADVNAGFRLEAGPLGDLSLVIGDPASKDPNHCRIHLFSRVPLVGVRHSLRLELEDGSLRITLDDEPPTELNDLKQVAASRVVLGNGFDGKRPLFGKASLVRMDAAKGFYVAYTPGEKRFLRWMRALAVSVHLALGGLLVLALRRHGARRDEETRAAAGGPRDGHRLAAAA